MFDNLKAYIKQVVSIDEEAIAAVDTYFQRVDLKKKEYLLHADQICDFVGYVDAGIIRHYHVKDGNELTCDLSLNDAWVADFESFTTGGQSKMYLQAMVPTTVYVIRKSSLEELYQSYPIYQVFGRKMSEMVANRSTNIALSLTADKPLERYEKLLKSQPELFEKVPQKYIANFLGLSPESVSRIRKRIIERDKS